MLKYFFSKQLNTATHPLQHGPHQLWAPRSSGWHAGSWATSIRSRESKKEKKKRESETNESPTDPSTEEKARASRAESATKGKQGNLAVLSLHPCPSTRRAAYEREPHLEVTTTTIATLLLLLLFSPRSRPIKTLAPSARRWRRRRPIRTVAAPASVGGRSEFWVGESGGFCVCGVLCW